MPITDSARVMIALKTLSLDPPANSGSLFPA